ncbi:unnamed protein product [Calypogeia fissa]
MRRRNRRRGLLSNCSRLVCPAEGLAFLDRILDACCSDWRVTSGREESLEQTLVSGSQQSRIMSDVDIQIPGAFGILMHRDRRARSGVGQGMEAMRGRAADGAMGKAS